MTGLRSTVVDDTVAVSVITPTWPGLTTNVMLALAPFAREPRSHTTVTTPFDLFVVQVPWLGLTETKLACAGIVSVTNTPLAVMDGSLLTTPMV